jgi:hypothetical protein
MRYIILNDGETYTSLDGCIIYDDVTNQIYQIRKGIKIDQYNSIINMHWEKGIAGIIDAMNNTDNDEPESVDEYVESNRAVVNNDDDNIDDNINVNDIVNEDDGILGK